jgi:hypothetical protein
MKKIIILSLILSGCAISAPVEKVSESSSHFGPIYSGEDLLTDTGEVPGERYRVFQQGATGYVSKDSVRETAEHRAIQFCKSKALGNNIIVVAEHVSGSVLVPGNFPKVELIFVCER